MTDAPPPPPPPPYPGAYPTGAYPVGAYPAGPYPIGGVPPQLPPAPQQPAAVAGAVKLMIAGAVLSVVSVVYGLTTLDGLKYEVAQRLREDDPYVSQSIIDATYVTGLAFIGAFGLLGAFLWIWMAWKNGQGRAWARVVATVFAALNIFGLLFTAVPGRAVEPLSVVLSVLSVVLGAVILVLLWRKESTQFYEGTSLARRGY